MRTPCVCYHLTDCAEGQLANVDPHSWPSFNHSGANSLWQILMQDAEAWAALQDCSSHARLAKDSLLLPHAALKKMGPPSICRCTCDDSDICDGCIIAYHILRKHEACLIGPKCCTVRTHFVWYCNLIISEYNGSFEKTGYTTSQVVPCHDPGCEPGW